jgi:hypothetical protein
LSVAVAVVAHTLVAVVVVQVAIYLEVFLPVSPRTRLSLVLVV